MPATEAQIRANKANAAKAKGPVSESGKSRSRANSYKHGLTGAGVVLAEGKAAEVEAMTEEFERDFRPTTGAGRVLIRRMAIHAIRLDRCVLQESAALNERVRQAEADFQAPEGVDAETAAQLRTEAGHRATFAPSHEACLARKYEASNERGFFKALKELRTVEKESKLTGTTSVATPPAAKLGSFFPAEESPPPAAKPEPRPAAVKPVPAPEPTRISPLDGPRPTKATLLSWDPTPPTAFELSFAAGRPR